MKFKNKKAGYTLEPKSDFVTQQLEKDKRFQKAGGKDKPAAGDGGQKEKPLEKMNKGELMALAAEKGVEVNENMTNAEMVIAIEEAEAEA